MTRATATLCLLLATALWGFGFIAQKSAMLSMGPLSFTGVRFIIGGILLLPLALRERRTKAATLSRRDWLFVGAMTLVFFIGSWLQQVGLASTTVTNGGFLTGLYVLFVPLIAFLVFRVQPHPLVLIGVALALVGIYLLNGARLDQLNIGDALIVLCAVFWAIHVLMLGAIASRTGLPLAITCGTFILAGLASTLLALAFEAPTLAQIGEQWLAVAYAGIASTAIGFTLQAVAQQYVPATNAALVLSSEALFAALGAALLLGERLLPIGYFGALVIFLAILLGEVLPPILLRRRARAEAVTT
jgi:drug/metabolite transporter (DMT)-like permease